MKSRYEKPTTTRGSITFFIWYNLPRFVLLGMIVLIALLGFSIGDKKATIQAEQEAAIKQERPPINTVVMEVQPDAITERLNLPGTIESWTRLNLTAEVAGAIEEVLVREGERVKKGDVLARIEANDYQVMVERSKAAYKLARADFERDKTVYEKGVIPPAELEARETAMRTAKADYDNARIMLERCTTKTPAVGWQ